MNEKMEDGLRLDDEGVLAVAAAADGFSFAYLKELFTSAMMKWIAAPGATPMSELMVQQVATLKEQMATSLEQMEGSRVLDDAT